MRLQTGKVMDLTMQGEGQAGLCKRERLGLAGATTWCTGKCRFVSWQAWHHDEKKWREGKVTGQFSPLLQRWRSKGLQARPADSCWQDFCACLVHPGRGWKHHPAAAARTTIPDQENVSGTLLNSAEA